MNATNSRPSRLTLMAVGPLVALLACMLPLSAVRAAGDSQLKRAWDDLTSARQRLEALGFDGPAFRQLTRMDRDKASKNLDAYRKLHDEVDAAETAYLDAQISLDDQAAKVFACSAACLHEKELLNYTFDGEIDGTKLMIEDLDKEISTAQRSDPKSVSALESQQRELEARLKELEAIRKAPPAPDPPNDLKTALAASTASFRKDKNNIAITAKHRQVYLAALEAKIPERPWLVGTWTHDNPNPRPPQPGVFDYKRASLTVKAADGVLTAEFLFSVETGQWPMDPDYRFECIIAPAGGSSWQGKWRQTSDEDSHPKTGTLTIAILDATEAGDKVTVAVSADTHVFSAHGHQSVLTGTGDHPLTLTRRRSP